MVLIVGMSGEFFIVNVSCVCFDVLIGFVRYFNWVDSKYYRGYWGKWCVEVDMWLGLLLWLDVSVLDFRFYC